MTSQRTLIVGIGSPHGDDRIGWLAIDRLRDEVSPEIVIRQASTPSQLFDWIDGFDRVIVCDACEGVDNETLSPIVHRWEWPTTEVEHVRSSDSHTFGLPAVLELAEKLGKLPECVIIYGMAGKRFDAFTDISPEVNAGLQNLVEMIACELNSAASESPLGAVDHA
ncbi:MAG: hydrogenase maturation protease [Planctomycetaceae bacterium]